MLVLTCILSLGGFFFVRGSTLMEGQLKEKLRTTAAMAAMQFDPVVLDRMRGRSAMETRAFTDVVERLRSIREQIPQIRFAYIMRKTADPSILEFVADADSLATLAELDSDRDGLVDTDEQASFPGDTYDIFEVPALQHAAFAGPTVDEEFTEDQWGTFMSGYAPIRDGRGNAIAVLGIDMDANDYLALSRSIFSPVAFLLLSLVGVVLMVIVGVFLWRRKIESLERLHRERSGLLLLAMHQIGSPLTIIRWSLEALLDQVGKGSLDSAVREHAHNVEQATGFLNTILSELREASEVDTGTMPYTREWVALKDIIHDIVEEMTPALRKHEQSIVLNVDPSLQLSLDRTLIVGVLRELLHNAMTFSPHGNAITITAKRGGKCVLVDVTDHGCGIAKTDIPRMFDKFIRGAKAHLYQPNGSGLGLYIAKGIIKRANGDIWIKSTEGKGTTVSFTLPC